MASETVDSIEWPLPPTRLRAVPLELNLHGANERTNQFAGNRSQYLNITFSVFWNTSHIANANLREKI